MKDLIWIKSAEKEFIKFPKDAQKIMLIALRKAVLGERSDIAKPLKHLEAGLTELALPFRGDAYRVVYTVRIGNAVYVLHSFKKKSTKGISTPKKEIDLVKSRLKQIKEALK